MALNYTGIASIAKKVIALTGGPVTLISSTSGKSYPVKGVLMTERKKPTDIVNHPSGDFPDTQVCYIDGLVKYEPQPQDKLVKDGTTFLITNVNKVKPASTTVYYKLSLGT